MKSTKLHPPNKSRVRNVCNVRKKFSMVPLKCVTEHFKISEAYVNGGGLRSVRYCWQNDKFQRLKMIVLFKSFY